MEQITQKKIECVVCGQKYYVEDMVLILADEAVCKFCNQEEK